MIICLNKKKSQRPPERWGFYQTSEPIQDRNCALHLGTSYGHWGKYYWIEWKEFWPRCQEMWVIVFAYPANQISVDFPKLSFYHLHSHSLARILLSTEWRSWYPIFSTTSIFWASCTKCEGIFSQTAGCILRQDCLSFFPHSLKSINNILSAENRILRWRSREVALGSGLS